MNERKKERRKERRKQERKVKPSRKKCKKSKEIRICEKFGRRMTNIG
jgi:hypothetical protein